MDYKKLLTKRVITAIVVLAAAVASAYGYNMSPDVKASVIEVIEAIASMEGS